MVKILATLFVIFPVFLLETINTNQEQNCSAEYGLQLCSWLSLIVYKNIVKMINNVAKILTMDKNGQILTIWRTMLWGKN